MKTKEEIIMINKQIDKIKEIREDLKREIEELDKMIEERND